MICVRTQRPWRSDVMLNAVAAAIERYQKIVESGGWPLVPQGRMMREGDDDPRVPILRKRLRITRRHAREGLLLRFQTFDSELTEGVKHFQKRNGSARRDASSSRSIRC